MELILIYAAVFVAGLMLFDWAIRSVLAVSQRSRSMNYRLKLLEDSSDHLAVYRNMVRERGLDYDRTLAWPVLHLRRLFAQSGIKVDNSRVILFGLLAVIVGWFALGFAVSSPLPRAGLLMVLVIGGAYLVLVRARRARIAKFIDQLPGALDVINRSLLSGHPLPSAIALVSRELPDPIGTEFGLFSDELTYGTEVDDAMLNMIERVGAEDLKLLAISMSVQRGTGGNFVEVLENLSNVIRDRAMLRQKVRALSAEGRITAIVMSAFPFLLYLMINTLAPTYFDPIWDSGYANVIIVVGLCIMLVGNIVLYKLVHFEF